jgi:ribosomal protein S18 acetylase RimI-like enzyme
VFAPYEPKAEGEVRSALPEGWRIRIATPQDIPAIAALMAEREAGKVEIYLGKLQREFARADIGEQRRLTVGEIDGAVMAFSRVTYCTPAPNAPPNAAPLEGWYLGGVVVSPKHRRHGVADALTRDRIEWLRARGATSVFFVVNAENRASIDLHARFGFREVTRDFVQPGVSFFGRGIGILYCADLISRDLND